MGQPNSRTTHLIRNFVPSPAGGLESLFELPAGFDGLLGVVLCHPHPLYWGTMRNKVVVRTAQALVDIGAAVLRFNFRGVEGSPGTHDEGRGEEEDVQAALTFLRQTISPRLLLLGGFSFGAWVALKVGVADPDVACLLAVGLPVRMYDFGFLGASSHSLFIVQGEQDEFGSPDDIAAQCRSYPAPCLQAIVKGADHFFTGRLNRLQAMIAMHYRALLHPPVQAGDHA